MKVPDSLRRQALTDEGRVWVDALPATVDGAVRRWSLRLGDPYAGGSTGLVMPAALPNGTPVVLKLAFPDRESLREADALVRWDGNGAVRLLDHDDSLGAMLLERCVPGTPLADLAIDEALDALTGLLPRLWVPAGHPFTTLTEEAVRWTSDLQPWWEQAGRCFPADLLTAALDALGELPSSQGPLVLVHQDLHAGNVLRAEREPWLAIDPKPLAGEREFSAAPIVRGGELGHSRDAVIRRLDRLCGALGLDRERARRWTLAQTIAWAFDGGQILREHIEVAQWLYDARDE